MDEIVADFPEISKDDIRAGLAFVADRERRLAQSEAALLILTDRR